MIAIDLNKQEVLDANPKGIQQFNFINQAGNTTLFFIIEEAKKIISDFSQRIVRAM